MKIRSIVGDRLMVDPIVEQEVEGVIVSTSTKVKPKQGKVLMKGNTCPLDVELGDIVSYEEHAGVEVSLKLHSMQTALVLLPHEVFAIYGNENEKEETRN